MRRLLNESIDTEDNYLCECTHPQSFGKYCEYLLPMEATFPETMLWEIMMRRNNLWEMQKYSDIVCYTTLICDYGLLCLDWRDICDGVQQCMFGYDEENCDTLEFNECEDDEYRCMNGICIPEEYFLDGTYDCLDLTDEKEQFNDTKCIFHPVSYECDDRICLRSYWSCGDGQCVQHERDIFPYVECKSFREYYHMCELFDDQSLWTLPNGKCYESSEYEEVLENHRTDSEECVYFIKCALSRGGEKNCPCGGDLSCIDELENPCSFIMQYPNGVVMARYTFYYHPITRDWSEKMPDVIVVNESTKCLGYMAHRQEILRYPSSHNLNHLRVPPCASILNIFSSVVNDDDRFCYNNSQTFNNRSYNFIDVCIRSKDCISAYRIQDGYSDCSNNEDEYQYRQFSNSCSNIRRHRFQCSDEQPSCLPVQKLGDGRHDCEDESDERLIEKGIALSELKCNSESQKDCEFIRRYVDESGKLGTKNSSDRQLQLTKTPFRALCDTFWNWNSAKDEDIELCQTWWRCAENQWQCHSGQCINLEWVLDEEWDCVDASDEQGLLFYMDDLTARNLAFVNLGKLVEKFNTLYKSQPFWNLCNLTVEYPCFRANVLDPLNITQNRPCIDLYRIGDGYIDCAGAIDERNNRRYYLLSYMLGYCFECSSAAECIPYWPQCSGQCDDNRVQCYGYKQSINCSGKLDFMCLNGECMRNGWCDMHLDCSHGEDELLCIDRKRLVPIPFYQNYRLNKELSIKTTKQKLRLPQFPINTNMDKTTNKSNLIIKNRLLAIHFSSQVNPSIPYYCNRGVGVYLYNGQIACFCPPQYYGDKCQFHNDRLIFQFYLNLSQSIYAQTTHSNTMLKLLVIFLNENQPLMTESFQIQLKDAINFPRKNLIHLLYSRSNVSLYHKRTRYFNRSDILNQHPYSVRIEVYELSSFEKARLVAVWLYPVHFDFLPSFRLVKVLHLIKPDTTTNPCHSNPCNPYQECHQILNQNATYICLCRPNYKGHNCSILDKMCEQDFCSCKSLCKPNYRGLLSSNEQPYCLCSLYEIGYRCDLMYDKCHSNPCRNHGTCLSTTKPQEFICLCDEYHYGYRCQLEKRAIRLYITRNPPHQATAVQYFDINFVSLDLLLVHQRVDVHLPNFLHYLFGEQITTKLIVVKLYSNMQSNIYLISIRIDGESINGTTEVSEKTHCPHVQTLFPTKAEINPFKYHYLCIQNSSLFCFIDESYLCICAENHNRTECFGYDHSLDQCSSCLAGGLCLKEDHMRAKFLCLCPQCYYGSSCQFNIEGISFTLDLLISQVNLTIQIMYFIFALLIFIIGCITNYAGMVTFKRPKLRKSSIGIYILLVLIINQYSLFSLIMKLFIILFHSLMNDISCKITSYMLSVSIRCSFWLTSLIAIERVSYLLFPFAIVLKKSSVARIISLATLLIVGIMHIHELIFYMKLTDQNERTLCVIDFPIRIRTYDRITVLFHYLIPFCIQILSITILLILAARNRSRIGNSRDTFIEYLKRQFRRQKELYIPPSVIVLSGLPQVIFSFSFACRELVTWQQHVLLIAYFLSFAPQLLGFIIYVLPSTNYMKEFQTTKLSKIRIFQWVLWKKKTRTSK
ncbi:unnamed protein product [Rotaria sp. Silwood1]|nr:unnamed protein product [Rotaria sp. Silwood1]